jgi:MGT family glycosyltransferase
MEGSEMVTPSWSAHSEKGSLNPRRYLFAVVDGGGNVPPELGAARRLLERGHSVTVLAEDSVTSDARATGAAVRPWVHAPNRPDRRPEHDPARDWECKYPWQLLDRLMMTMLLGPAPGYAQDVLGAVGETVPDLVVCSMFCVGGMVAAEAADIPFDVMLPNIYPFPADGLPPFGMGLRPARGPAGRIRDRVINALGKHLWDAKGLAGLNALRQRYHLSPLPRFFDQVGRARRLLVLTSAAFDFPARLPGNARYVGPVLDEPAWAHARAWTTPPGSSPLVLVALSSTFQDQIGCLQRIVDALSTMPVRAIVTTGPAVDVTALRPSPTVVIVECAPHRQVMQQAALVITHGGHGTVMKALAAGVPLVVLPHGRDQGDTAARVSARGAGVTLARMAGVRAISRAVLHVLRHDSYRSAARKLGAAILRDADADVLVRELEALPNRNTRKNLKYRVSVFALTILLTLGSHAFALDKHRAAYVWGTLTQFNNATDRTEGRLDVTDARQLLFTPDGRSADGRTVRIDYATILDLEFGQKVTRRLATTLGATALAGPFALLTPSKKRQHFLTITYVDEQRRNQVLTLELGDEVVRRTLAALESRSGKPVEFRDEEARKWSR